MNDLLSDDPDAPATAPPPGRTGRRLARRAVNLWLVFHLAAVVIAPASVSPSSDLIGSAWEVFRPYLDVLYLNHGYHFFAPEPSYSKLLSFEAERADGTTVRGRIPDRATAPRLLYHRYFMLTEHMSDEEGDDGRPLRDEERPLFESYARHLGQKYHARKVTLTRQKHHLPDIEWFRDGGELDVPEAYEARALGVFRCDGS